MSGEDPRSPALGEGKGRGGKKRKGEGREGEGKGGRWIGMERGGKEMGGRRKWGRLGRGGIGEGMAFISIPAPLVRALANTTALHLRQLVQTRSQRKDLYHQPNLRKGNKSNTNTVNVTSASSKYSGTKMLV